MSQARNIGQIDLNQHSNSIFGPKPGRLWHSGIIRRPLGMLATKSLNECKCFSYNQLKQIRPDCPGRLARCVHLVAPSSTLEKPND
jgi:hypothetical protein